MNKIQTRPLLSKRLLILVGIVLIAAKLFSCAKRSGKSDTDGISLDPNAGNLALLFEGNIPQAVNDMKRLKAILEDTQGGYGFQTETYNSMTSAQIHAKLKESVPAKLGPNGTLFLFFAGHGSPSGQLQTRDGSFISYKTVAQNIREVMPRPVKRVFIVIFSCYSGSWINNIKKQEGITVAANGSGAVTVADQAAATLSEMAADNTATELTAGETTPWFEQLIIGTAANANELSYFNGSGSLFIQYFSKHYQTLKTTNPDATINDLFTATHNSVVKLGSNSSRVTYKSYPNAQILDEPLFKPGVPPQVIPPFDPKDLPRDLKVAIYDAKDANTYNIFLSSEPAITELRICTASTADCIAKPNSDIWVRKIANPSKAKSYYQINSAMKAADFVGKTWNLIGLNKDGIPSAFRPMIIQSK